VVSECDEGRGAERELSAVSSQLSASSGTGGDIDADASTGTRGTYSNRYYS